MTVHPTHLSSRRHATTMASLCMAAAALSPTTALMPSPLTSLHRYQQSNRSFKTQQHYLTPKHSPLEDEPWQKDDSYWDQLQQASKDPETFEKFIEESVARKKMGKPMASTKINGMDANGTAGGDKPKKKGGYVPIEEWDASRANGENMSKEERLQWECQRSGNQFRQNEILLHNLKSF